MESVLIFSRTKYGADKIVKILNKAQIKSDAIHGNKTQGARQRALNNFKDKKSSVLVATDIAARGIDVEKLSLVINYDLPNISETYIHRIGRTGRAEKSGIAWSFCDIEERPFLRDIEKLIREKIAVVEEHPYVDEQTSPPPKKQVNINRSQNRSGSDKHQTSSGRSGKKRERRQYYPKKQA